MLLSLPRQAIIHVYRHLHEALEPIQARVPSPLGSFAMQVREQKEPLRGVGQAVSELRAVTTCSYMRGYPCKKCYMKQNPQRKKAGP